VSLVALAVVLLLVLLLRKAVRVRRRHGGDPRRRIVGAWQESLDVLVEAGLPDVTASTTSEIVAATQHAFGADSAARARSVGTAADVAVFSPTAWLHPAEADRAWQEHAALRRAVRQHLTLGQRIAARLRYAPSGRVRPPVAPTSWDSAGDSRPGHRASGGRRH
jgi:hypothetical protein